VSLIWLAGWLLAGRGRPTNQILLELSGWLAIAWARPAYKPNCAGAFWGSLRGILGQAKRI